MSFSNAYSDEAMASAYSRLEFTGTYYLAFRDIPSIIAKHVTGHRALDFGCGAGRSSRFVRSCGFEVTGVDIAESMLAHARAADPEGDYRLVPDDDFAPLGETRFDLIFSAFTFDNIPAADRKIEIFRALRDLLKPNGKIVNLVSSPEIYLHEWASFTTTDFVDDNRKAKSGDVVRIINTDIDDRRPVDDILFPDEAYRDVYSASGLVIEHDYRPLGRDEEPYAWVTETRVAPWVVYVLRA